MHWSYKFKTLLAFDGKHTVSIPNGGRTDGLSDSGMELATGTTIPIYSTDETGQVVLDMVMEWVI